MASVAHLLLDAENIITEIEGRARKAEENSYKYYILSRTIQRHVRGLITRNHLVLLHRSATIIQKYWRRCWALIYYRKMLKEKFYKMCVAHYNKKASTIQRWWKGYKIRAKEFNFHGLKNWLGFVGQQNKLYKCIVEEYQNKNNISEMKQREEEAKEWIVYILFKLHHLLRTHQISGIYSLPNTTELSDIEKMLKCLQFKDFMVFYNSYMDDVRQRKTKEIPSYIFKHCKYIRHFEKEYHEAKKLRSNALFLNSGVSYYEIKKQGDIELSSKFRTKEYPIESNLQPYIVEIQKCKACPCNAHCKLTQCKNVRFDT